MPRGADLRATWAPKAGTLLSPVPGRLRGSRTPGRLCSDRCASSLQGHRFPGLVTCPRCPQLLPVQEQVSCTQCVRQTGTGAFRGGSPGVRVMAASEGSDSFCW